MTRRFALAAGVTALGISTLACEPVFVVGWQELTCIVLLAALLVGPLVYRLTRAWIKFQESRKPKDR
jgi:hypothetical protein